MTPRFGLNPVIWTQTVLEWFAQISEYNKAFIFYISIHLKRLIWQSSLSSNSRSKPVRWSKILIWLVIQSQKFNNILLR